MKAHIYLESKCSVTWVFPELLRSVWCYGMLATGVMGGSDGRGGGFCVPLIRELEKYTSTQETYELAEWFLKLW